MTKNQKLAITISSGFMIAVLTVLSLSSSANVGEKSARKKLSAPCIPGVPSLKILTPDGGEVYSVGQQMTITWESCGLPPTELLDIWLAIPSLGWDLTFILGTPNDGIETIIIPNNMSPNFGNIFKLHMVKTISPNTPPIEYSDDLFTINPAGGCYAKDDLWGYDGSTDTWTQKANFPISGRYSAVAFSIGSKGYIGTGIGDDSSLYKDFWEWNQDTDEWTQKEDFGGSARKEAVGFSIGDEGYIGTGKDANGAISDFWEWDQATDTWIKKTDFGGGARSIAVGFSISHKGYIGTGRDDSGYKKDFWEFDPAGLSGAGSWTKKTDFGGGERFEAVGFGVEGKGYIGTGSSGWLQPLTTYKDFWEYDPITDEWTQKADFGGGLRSRAVGYSTLGSGKGYIGTGVSGDDTSYKKDFWEYDPITDEWTQKANYGTSPTNPAGLARAGAVGFSIRDYGFIGTGIYCNEEPPLSCEPNSWNKKEVVGGGARVYATGFSIGTKGYIGTGRNTSGNLEDFWEYDQVTGKWIQKADFGGGARFRAVGFSIGNKGYIGTGTIDESSGLNDFFQYDPALNDWTSINSLGTEGRFGAVAFSIKDKGYVGTGHTNTAQNDFYEYDPITGKWLQKGNFGGKPRLGAVGFSLDGKGYIGTGTSSNLFSTDFKDFYQYDPVSDIWTPKDDVGGLERKEAVGFGLNNKGYIGTGIAETGTLLDFWAYDPSIEKWSPKANYTGGGGQPNVDAVGFSIGDKGYIGTGFPSGNNFWEYCPD